MSDSANPLPIGWLDLTVDDADGTASFYQAVLGLARTPISMDGGYDDYVLHPAGKEGPACGVCHRRGTNAKLPAVWIPYFEVEALDAALEAATAGGGKLIDGPKSAGPGKKGATLTDPSGATFAIIGPSGD